MSHTLAIDITGLKGLLNKLKASTKDSVIMEGLFVAGLNLSAWSKRNRLTGPRPGFLGVRTGRLRSSILVAKTVKRGSSFITRIGTNVKYARIHEEGGKAGRNKSVLIPARPFLKPALEDRKNQTDTIRILKRRLELSIQRQR